MKLRTLVSVTLSALGIFGTVSGAETPPLQSAGIAIATKASPIPATEDGPIALTITVTNRGPGTAIGVVVTNRLPSGIRFVRSEPLGLVSGGQEGEEVVIPLGNLPAGLIAIASLTARISDVHFEGDEGTIVTNKTAANAVNAIGPVVVALPIPVFVQRDWGDAPDPTYPVLWGSNGARHRINGLFLGALVDAEPNGLPTGLANGDDANGSDDEDGVVGLTPFTAGGVANVQVTASLAGVLDAWADFNADGDWFDAGEHIVVGAAVPAGASTFAIPVPAWAAVGRCYLRFRLSPGGAPTPVGFINGGEVEDYVVEMKPAGAGVAHAGELQMQKRGRSLLLTWDRPNSLLQAAPTVDGPWTTLIEANSPVEFTPNAEQRFFRLIEGRSASRSGLDRRNFASLAREADLIIDAVVTDITYRNSDGDGTNDVSWPHTFVTVRVLDVLKGRLTGTNLCLRFLGGLDADGERIMKVSESTRFDVGERSILFVKRNGFLARPLVGGAEGRLRIANGLVYSEHGHRLVLTASQKLAFGIRDILSEEQEDRIGTNVVGRAHSDANGEAPRPERPTGEHLGVAAFKSTLTQIIQQNHIVAELQNPVLTPSADSTRAFRIQRPRHRPPPSAITELPPAGAAENDEAARVRAHGGNPVLALDPLNP